MSARNRRAAGRRAPSNDTAVVRAEFEQIVAGVPGRARMLATMLDWAIDATHADMGIVQIVDPRDGSLRIAAQHGFRAPFLAFFRVVTNDASASSIAMRRGTQIVVPNVRVSSLYSEPARAAMLDAHACACQSTPIASSGGRVLGVVSTHFGRPRRPTQRQLRRVSLMARLVATLLERPRMAPPAVDVTIIVDEIRDGSPKTRTIRG